MKRDYESGTKSDVTMFIGNEVEHTPAHNMPTLFVVGIQSLDKIIYEAEVNDCFHIYLGANQSFNPSNSKELKKWRELIVSLLKEDFLVTLDFDVKYIDEIHQMKLHNFKRFIAQISVKIPSIDRFNYNTCLKIDDVDFDSTNLGVWVHNLFNLQDRSKFTDWAKYTKDIVLK